MAKIEWDKTGERFYETGVDHAVLYLSTPEGYTGGVAWNGITSINESPEGAESNPQYADNIKYINLVSAEEFKCTVEAFTYPDEFAECNGELEITPGVTFGQQTRKSFGLSYRTNVGNDVDGQTHGYKLHLIYGGQASPSEKSYQTINDSPEAITFSWEINTTPVAAGADRKPVSSITIDSTRVSGTNLTALENVLYGTDTEEPRLPLPEEVVTLLGGSA